MSVKLQIFHSKQCTTLKHVHNWIPRDIQIFPFDQEIHCYLVAYISTFVGFQTFIVDTVTIAVFCILTPYSWVSTHWCFKETCWMFVQNASVYLHNYTVLKPRWWQYLFSCSFYPFNCFYIFPSVVLHILYQQTTLFFKISIKYVLK
jgi:hypothetical protein